MRLTPIWPCQRTVNGTTSLLTYRTVGATERRSAACCATASLSHGSAYPSTEQTPALSQRRRLATALIARAPSPAVSTICAADWAADTFSPHTLTTSPVTVTGYSTVSFADQQPGSSIAYTI